MGDSKHPGKACTFVVKANDRKQDCNGRRSPDPATGVFALPDPGRRRRLDHRNVNS